jgi:hypothetical protein
MTRLDPPVTCPICKKPGPFHWASQSYHYDAQHPLRDTEPAKTLVAVTTTWVCEACKQKFRVESRQN